MIDPDHLARLTLFADLPGPALEAIAQRLDEEAFPRGARVLREGLSGTAFYVIVEGSVSVVIAGTPRETLGPGEFFGEVSILTGGPVVADIVSQSDPLRCAVLGRGDLRPLLIEHPVVAIRMLEAGARRLRKTNLWVT